MSAIYDSMPDDVSRIIGKFTVKLGGKEYVVGPFSFEAWSIVQEKLLTQKRKRMIESLVAVRDSIEAATYNNLFRETMNQVGNTAALTPQDANYIFTSPAGIGLCIWVMIELQYKADPGRPSLQQCVNHAMTCMEDGDLTILLRQLMACMGIPMEGDAGNENGQPVT